MKHYKPINNWTKSKMIKQIENHMLNHKSYGVNVYANDVISCLYKAPDNNKCAAGVFIPDSSYKKYFENSTFSVVYHETKKHMPLCRTGMFELQSIHDCCNNNENPKPHIIKWIQENVRD